MKWIIMLWALLLVGCNQQWEIDEKTADCIAQHSIIYISTGCRHCLTQENTIGPYFDRLNVVDCLLDGDICSENNITGVPTWIINGKRYGGVLGSAELVSMAGCLP